jgi:hypothetical protein
MKFLHENRDSIAEEDSHSLIDPRMFDKHHFADDPDIADPISN